MKQNFLLMTFVREMKLYSRSPIEWCQPLIFFIIFTGIFALMLGKSPKELQENAVGIIWSAYILGIILAQDRFFYVDHENGVLEQILLCSTSKLSIILIKILTHCIFVGLPLIFLAILIGFLFDLDKNALFKMASILLICLPSINLIGAICNALTLSLKKGGILLGILTLPLISPIVLFGASACYSASLHLSLLPHYAILLAILFLLLPLSPLACLFALEISCEN